MRSPGQSLTPSASLLAVLLSSLAQGQSFVLPLSTVPGGGVGPARTYKFGKFEVTNQQFADFLNNAQLDGGATPRSSHMVFQPNGVVQAPDGSVMFRPFPSSRVIYIAGSPIGARYTPEAAFGTHPITSVSWLGAVKFCNWLTIDHGLGVDERCYFEGAEVDAWRPVTVSEENWAAGMVNEMERQALIDECAGFRLPMDGLAIDSLGWIGQQENAFNEWYKLAAYDPQAPDATRIGPGGESASPDHWLWGFGRDAITGSSANYLGSGDPFEFSGTTPAGYYNGTNFGTMASQNRYAAYDVSGNVFEWTQEFAGDINGRAIRGGSWNAPSAQLAAAYRTSIPAGETRNDVGFRVLIGVPPPREPDGDANGDGLITLADLAAFVLCPRGPSAMYDSDGLHIVTINVGPGFSFSPPNVTIEVGDTIRWDWVGGTHNVSSGVGGFHDGNFYSGAPTGNTNFFFNVTFDEAFLVAHPMSGDVYPFYCEPHIGFGMIGSVSVDYDPCFPFDFDRGGTVDLLDVGAFQLAFSGD